MNSVLGWFVIAGVAVLYMLPLFIGAIRNCKRVAGIFVINLFLGWTFIGWVVALAWAVSGDPMPKKA